MERKSIGKKLNKIYHKFKPLFIVVFVLIGIFTGSTFAKYYSMQQQKGVALASDFYFSSDIMQKGLILDSEGLPTAIESYVGANIWNVNGTSSKVNFVIRNYANYLLYNDENIQIEYDLYAMVAEEDNSGKITYWLNYMVDGQQQSVQLSSAADRKPVKLTDSIKGGEPLTNAYSIEYKYASAVGIFPENVYIWVVPTAPTYIPAEEYSMGCAISVKEVSAEFTFQSGWGFVELQDAEAALTTIQTNTINAQAGFVYNVSTTGSNTAGTDKNKVKVRLSWNSNYIELDRFSKFYNASGITTDANGIKSLDIIIDTYTSNDILFYRKSGFKVSDFATQGAFADLVSAVYVPENQ